MKKGRTFNWYAVTERVAWVLLTASVCYSLLYVGQTMIAMIA